MAGNEVILIYLHKLLHTYPIFLEIVEPRSVQHEISLLPLVSKHPFSMTQLVQPSASLSVVPIKGHWWAGEGRGSYG